MVLCVGCAGRLCYFGSLLVSPVSRFSVFASLCWILFGCCSFILYTVAGMAVLDVLCCWLPSWLFS